MTDQRAMFSNKGYKGYLRACLIVFCSPEASNVLWCGDGVHKRECIPSDLYNGVQAIVKEQSKQEKVHDGIKNTLMLFWTRYVIIFIFKTRSLTGRCV